MACEELAELLRTLDAADKDNDSKRQVELLIERIRQHREQHATCDYKPAVQ